MAGYPWTFTVSPDTITEVTVTDGVTTVTVQATGGGMIVQFFETSAFPETTDVTISATGYNDVTAVVGTTSSVTFTEASTTPTAAYLSDGTNTYEIEDSQARADIQEIQSNYVTMATLEAIYPVGSVYIGTQATCPMSTVMSGTTWTLVSSGKALWTGNGSNGNTTIAAGLPNITGTAQVAPGRAGYVANGAFSQHSTENATNVYASGTQSTRTQYGIGFYASNSNSIYGNSTTVQPPAYVVNVWRRTV